MRSALRKLHKTLMLVGRSAARPIILAGGQGRGQLCPHPNPMLRRGLIFFCTVMPLLAQVRAEDLQIFLLIGQSNMAGRGVVEVPDQTPHPTP